MPYKSVVDLPDRVKNALPASAQRLFLDKINEAFAKGKSEEDAFEYAWGIVKKNYKPSKDGKWVKMKEDFRYIVPFASDEWKLYFPLGTVYHRGRKIDFKKSDAEEMVKNFKKECPNYPLPINILHKDELGVYGHIADLRVTDKGVEWKPEFRPEKEAEIKDKGYKYASPEIIFKRWTHPKTGEVHNNIAAGIALTPRPRLGRATAVFSEETQEWEVDESDVTVSDLVNAVGIIKKFKDLFVITYEDPDESGDLEEVGEYRKEDHMGEELNEEQVAQTVWEKMKEYFKPIELEVEDVKPEPQNDFSEQMAEMEAKFNELSEKLAEKETEIASITEAKEKAEEEAQKYSERFIEEEQKRRLAEFTEKATELNVPVKAEEFAEVLMHFHDADDSEEKARYAMLISVLEAKGNADTMSKLFEESGTDAVGASNEDRLGALVKERMEKFDESYADATVKVLQLHPEIYNDYNRGIRSQSTPHDNQGTIIVA